MWDLIVSVPDHCLSFYFSLRNVLNNFCSKIMKVCETTPCAKPCPLTLVDPFKNYTFALLAYPKIGPQYAIINVTAELHV